MTDDSRDLDERLARLAAETEPLGPRGDFEERVMQAIAVEAVPRVHSSLKDWRSGVLQTGGFALAAATLLAVGALVLAVQSQRLYDDEAALASTAVEVGW